MSEDIETLLRRYQGGLTSSHGAVRANPPKDARASRPDEYKERPLANVELGDIVKLEKPYPVRSELYGQERTVFTHGIVAEILSRLPDGRTRNVSLYLYSTESRHIYLGLNGIPEFVDCHCSEFTLYKRATEMGYLPTDPNAPPERDA